MRAGGGGIDLARVLWSRVGALVIDIAAPEIAACKTPVAIFAHRGFGRDGAGAIFGSRSTRAVPPGKDVQKLAEAILYPLWDAEVDAGHAVRAFDQALALPANDLAAATALLDARYLTGDRVLAGQVPAGGVPRAGRQDRGGGLRRSPARRAEGTPQAALATPIFLLEPVRKSGPGGPARSLRGPLGRGWRASGRPTAAAAGARE